MEGPLHLSLIPFHSGRRVQGLKKTSLSLLPQCSLHCLLHSPLSLTGLPHSSEAKCSGSAIGTFPGRACIPGGRHSPPGAHAHSLAVPGTEPGLPPAPRRTDLAVDAHWALYTWWEGEPSAGFRSFTSASVTHPGLHIPVLHTLPAGEIFQRKWSH